MRPVQHYIQSTVYKQRLQKHKIYNILKDTYIPIFDFLYEVYLLIVKQKYPHRGYYDVLKLLPRHVRQFDRKIRQYVLLTNIVKTYTVDVRVYNRNTHRYTQVHTVQLCWDLYDNHIRISYYDNKNTPVEACINHTLYNHLVSILDSFIPEVKKHNIRKYMLKLARQYNIDKYIYAVLI